VAATGFARGPDGDLYVADHYNRRILRLAAGSNAVTHVAELSDEIVRGARVSIDVAADGTLYVGDAGYSLEYHAGGGIFRVDPATGSFSRIAGQTEWETRGGFGCPQTGWALSSCVFPYQVRANPADGSLLFAGTQLARLDGHGVIYRIDTDTTCAGDAGPYFTSFTLTADGSALLGSFDRIARLPADVVSCRPVDCQLALLESGAACGTDAPSDRTDAWLAKRLPRLRTLVDGTRAAQRRAARLAGRLARRARRDRSTAVACRRALRNAFVDLRRAIRAQR
jgi:hypothetical protein